MIHFMTDAARTEKHGKQICTIHNVDGYTTRKTILGAVHEIGKAIAKIDAGEGQILVDVKTEAEAKQTLVPNCFAEHGTSYCFELEEVECASEWDEETEEMKYEDGNFYFHIRFFVWEEIEAEEIEAAEIKEKETEAMKKYRNIDTNEIWTEEEIREAFEQFRYEMENAPEDFETYLEDLIAKGRSRTGGFEEVAPRYIIMDVTKTDIFTEEYGSREEAIKNAVSQWDGMSKRDKKNTLDFYVLESINPDEDAPDHFDGEVIWNAKEQFFVKYHTEAGEDERERDIIDFGGFGFYDEWTE